jgi:hypothetical protein
LCRSCPGYAAQAHARFRGANAGELASGEQFRCKPNQNHLLCQCCLEPLPDRRTDIPQITITCSYGLTLIIGRAPLIGHMCNRFFCDQYWAAGCGGLRRLPNCSCFKNFKGYLNINLLCRLFAKTNFLDTTFEAKDMDGILFNNQFESDIFKVRWQLMALTYLCICFRMSLRTLPRATLMSYFRRA